MAVETKHLYIVRDKEILGGEPIVKGTRTPVRAIVELWRMGLLPEEIRIKLPHLTLAQIFNAMSYYEDHNKKLTIILKRILSQIR